LRRHPARFPSEKFKLRCTVSDIRRPNSVGIQKKKRVGPFSFSSEIAAIPNFTVEIGIFPEAMGRRRAPSLWINQSSKVLRSQPTNFLFWVSQTKATFWDDTDSLSQLGGVQPGIPKTRQKIIFSDDGCQCEPQYFFLPRKLCISKQKEHVIFREEKFGGSRKLAKSARQY
jgi:hypothetical protein